MENLEKNVKEFEKEFGEILAPVKFLLEKDPKLCASFLKLHDIALKDGVISKKVKFLIHAAITASKNDLESTIMHLIGAIRAGATEVEIFETAVTIIPVAGMPSFGTFLSAWNKALQKLEK
ncbi:MAG: carboxymuconolactone decarboxylase family protein [Dictyoglomus turgidum]|uniref:carboxymuconolactone decarboxylase family protein n=1 Tax=Dictyoglomus turgidum TaxID=513050 RepID=UPI003C7698F9